MGMRTDAPVNLNQGRQNAQEMPSINMNDTNAFKDTMMMVREKAKAMGLPEGKFEKTQNNSRARMASWLFSCRVVSASSFVSFGGHVE